MKYCLLFFFSFHLFAQALDLGKLNRPVIDRGNFLSSKEVSLLDSLIRQISQQGGPQIGILTVKEMQGYPIEEYAIRVAEKWKLGSESKDNGLLILLAKKEREVRIEVGQGLEGDITDAQAAHWIRNQVTPLFKQGRFFEGIGVILLNTADIYKIKLNQRSPIKRVRRKKDNNLLFFIFFFMLPLFLSRFSRRRSGFSSGLLYGAALGGLGSRSSSGSFGGGSFGGGGGGFSGGGASGGW